MTGGLSSPPNSVGVLRLRDLAHRHAQVGARALHDRSCASRGSAASRIRKGCSVSRISCGGHCVHGVRPVGHAGQRGRSGGARTWRAGREASLRRSQPVRFEGSVSTGAASARRYPRFGAYSTTARAAGPMNGASSRFHVEPMQATATAPAGVGNIGVGLRPAGAFHRRPGRPRHRAPDRRAARCAWSRCAARWIVSAHSVRHRTQHRGSRSCTRCARACRLPHRLRGRTRQGHSDRRGARRFGGVVRGRADRGECVARCAAVARGAVSRSRWKANTRRAAASRATTWGRCWSAAWCSPPRRGSCRCARPMVARGRGASGPGAGNTARARSAGRPVSVVDASSRTVRGSRSSCWAWSAATKR